MGVQDLQRMQAAMAGSSPQQQSVLAGLAPILQGTSPTGALVPQNVTPQVTHVPAQGTPPPGILPPVGTVNQYMQQGQGPTPQQVATGFGASMVPPGPAPPALTGNLEEILRLVLGDPKIKMMYGVP